MILQVSPLGWEVPAISSLALLGCLTHPCSAAGQDGSTAGPLGGLMYLGPWLGQGDHSAPCGLFSSKLTWACSLRGQGTCAKASPSPGLELVQYGSFTSHWPKQVTGPAWSHEWKTDSTYWEEPQGHIIGGVDTEGRTMVAIFVNVGPHPLTELLRFLVPHGDSLKS